ncbi:MAG: hypothetical protein M1828_002044 [Chrysothrix sp. TS-e1954]|nr:MAG: hypothetical protein M1828_002044 [Chrysothrix sp. TS-e1954]
MPELSPYNIDIPETDLLTWLFPPGSEPSNKPIWYDAENPERSLSPRQALQWARRLGLGLKRLGLQEDDVVMIHSTNHIFVPVAYLGAAGHGYIFSGSNPAYGVSEIKFQIENTGAKVLLVDPILLDAALRAADQAKFPRSRIFLFSDTECRRTQGLSDWRTILAHSDEASGAQWRRLSPEEHRSKIAVLNYSSGTTGLPKGVMITHQNVIANVTQSLYMRRLQNESTSSLQPTANNGRDERWLGFLPLYHAYGQLWSISAACLSLTPCYFMRSFDFPKWLSHIQTHQITHIQTAPPLLVMLAKRPETSKFDLSSLRNILCGAAPLSAELQNEVMSKVGRDLKVVQTWGMTELTCSSLHVPGLMHDLSGAVGLPDPNCQVKLISDEGKEVGDGERGEVHVKGPNVCRGYWRNEAATRDTFDEDGFLKTGDVAIRKKGWYWIVDRKKELIKVKGFQVAPAELEAVLLENDYVADAAVVALQMEYEELPRAYISLKDEAQGGGVKEADIVNWTAQRVARHKQLTGGVKFVKEVPKSPSGKIQRVIMRKWAKEDKEEMEKRPKAKL